MSSANAILYFLTFASLQQYLSTVSASLDDDAPDVLGDPGAEAQLPPLLVEGGHGAVTRHVAVEPRGHVGAGHTLLPAQTPVQTCKCGPSRLRPCFYVDVELLIQLRFVIYVSGYLDVF